MKTKLKDIKETMKDIIEIYGIGPTLITIIVILIYMVNFRRIYFKSK